MEVLSEDVGWEAPELPEVPPHVSLKGPDAITAYYVSLGQAIPKKIGAPIALGWNDKHLERRTANLTLDKELKNPVIAKEVLIRFYNFYFNGDLHESDQPHHVVYNVLALLPRDPTKLHLYDYFFSRPIFGDKSYYDGLPAGNMRLADQWGAPINNEIPKAMAHLGPAELANLYIDTSTQKDFQTFHTSVRAALLSFPLQGITPASILFINVTCYLALLLNRAISKDRAQMARAVNKKSVRGHLHNMLGWGLDKGYSPPCASCIDKCVIDLNKSCTHAKKMVALILKEFNDQSIAGDCPMASLLHAGFLTHTAGNGMGLLSLLRYASEVTKMTIKDIMMHTHTVRTRQSWVLIGKALALYDKVGQASRVWMWARLINDGYFLYYTARDHPYLCGIFAGIISKTQRLGSVKEALWFQDNRSIAEAGYQVGLKVITKLAVEGDEGLTPEAKAVLNFRLPQQIEDQAFEMEDSATDDEMFVP